MQDMPEKECACVPFNCVLPAAYIARLRREARRRDVPLSLAVSELINCNLNPKGGFFSIEEASLRYRKVCGETFGERMRSRMVSLQAVVREIVASS